MKFPTIDPEYLVDFEDDVTDIDRVEAWDERTASAVAFAKEKASAMTDLNESELFGSSQTDASSDPNTDPEPNTSDAWTKVEQEAKAESEANAQRSIKECMDYFDAEYFVSFHGPHLAVYQEICDDDGRKSLKHFTDASFKKFHIDKKVPDLAKDGTVKMVPVVSLWLEATSRRYERIVFDPTGKHRPEHYNLWRGFGVTPSPYDEDRIKLITEGLILKRLCRNNQTNADYLLDWLAHGVQYPAVKPGVAVALQGREGTGKGTLGRLMLRLWANHGITVSHCRHLTGNFNAHLRGTIFVFSDEATYAGDPVSAQVLKALITEEYSIIEQKGVDATLDRNYVRLLLATNSDWVVTAAADARRYFVLDVCDKLPGMATEESRSFWYRYNSYVDNGGDAEFLDYLLKRNLTNFIPEVFPQTDALARQRLLSLDPVTEFLVNAVNDGTLVSGSSTGWETDEIEVPKSDLLDAVLERAKKRGLRASSISAETVGTKVKDLKLRDTRPRVGKIQRPHYVFPPRAELAKRLIEIAKLPKDLFAVGDDGEDSDG